MTEHQLHSGADVPTGVDSLGFDKHVRGVCRFVVDADLPLTMSVEAEWGGGKTSFMRQVKRILDKLHKAGGPVRTVWFNAWRHDKDDALWAAFALQFMDQLGKKAGFWGRRLAECRLLRARYDWHRGGWLFVRFLFGIGAWIVVGIAALFVSLTLDQVPDEFWDGFFDFRWIAGFVVAAPVLGFLRRAKGVLGNPLQHDLAKYVDKLNYGERVSFIERFHKDFARIVQAYLGPDPRARVFVFIDDLDRCETPKAADLLQALNLLIPVNSADDGVAKRVVYILGIDRQKVAAALTAKYKDLLPYLHSGSEASPNSSDADQSGAADFGYRFIEKFVQLPFWLPRANEDDLVASLRGKAAEPDGKAEAAFVDSLKKRPSAQDGDAADEWSFRNDLDDDFWEHLLRMATGFLGKNPRRCKQFRSILMLRAGIWCDIEHPEDDDEKSDTIWPGQFAKIVLISLHKPLFYRKLQDSPELLQQLATVPKEARKAGDEADDDLFDPAPVSIRHEVQGWLDDSRLRALLAWTPKEADDDVKAKFSLARFDANKVDRMMSALPVASVQVAVQEARRIEEDSEPADRSEGPAPGHEFDVRVTGEEKGGKDYTILDFGQGVTMRLVRIPDGEFQMGSPEDEEDRFDGETLHPVHITKPFYMGVLPVTQAQYEAIMGANPSQFPGSGLPVAGVSWYKAQEVCRRLSAKAGVQIALPTEAQWEYACRAGSQERFCFGDDELRLGAFAWYGASGRPLPCPAGGVMSNGFGLHDMHGNVYEWCQDWFGKYPDGSVDDPTGPSEGNERVCRGGSWNCNARVVRSAYRSAFEPGFRAHDTGFRLVLGQ